MIIHLLCSHVVKHMDDAIDELDSIIDEETKDDLMKYFRHMASTFVVATERCDAIAAMKLDEDVPVNNFPDIIERGKAKSNAKNNKY